MTNWDLDYLLNIIKNCSKMIKELKQEKINLTEKLKEEKEKKQEAIKLINQIEEELKKRL
ncbi:MAG: hypothetical protein ABIN61_07430 [candidate division WOR-3 bacterium]